MLRCIHCGCMIPTAGTNKCPSCGEYPYSQKSNCGKNAAQKPILRTKEEKEGWEMIRELDKL